MEKSYRSFSRIGYLAADPVLLLGGKDGKSKSFLLLWQGALKTLGGVPFEIVDPERGFLQTQWYTDSKDPAHRFRVQVVIYPSKELCVESVNVELIHQIFKNGVWMLTFSSRDGAQDIKKEILLNARASLAIDRQKALEPEL